MPALAGGPPATPLRLADVLEAARQANPAVHAARERARAAAAVPARSAAYDDPVVSWESWNIPRSFAIDRADNNIVRLSQRVPFPGKRTLAGRMAEREAEAGSREADGVALDVAAAVKRAFWDLWKAHQAHRILARTRTLTARHVGVTTERYATSEAPQTDVLRAQIELTHAVSRLTTQEFTIEGARAELNALLSRPPGDPLGVPEDPPPARLGRDPDTLAELGLATRPELAAQAALVEREARGLELARRGYLPDFEFSFGRFVNSGSDDGFGAIASMTIPLAYKSKYDAGVEEASAKLSAAQADLRRLQDQVRREVRQAWLRCRAALLEHELAVTTHIPHAEQALRAADAAYASGATDFLSLVDTLRTIESIHMTHVEAAAEFEKAYADLERTVGSDLDRTAPAGDPPAPERSEPR